MRTPFGFLILLLILACNKKGKKEYTLNDFNEPTRSHLKSIITDGIVGYGSTSRDYIDKHASIPEFFKMSESEHPIIRMLGIDALMEKRDEKKGDFDLIMKHVSDTAILTFDDGEFGYHQRTIADEILFNGRWNTEEELNKTIEEVITRYNHMRSAYYVMAKVKPEPKLYSFIKDMALRQQDRPFDETEQAIYRLATYQKKEDVPLIKAALLENCWRMDELSFKLLRTYPDTAYIEVLNKFARSGYATRLSGYHNDHNPFIYDSFFKTLVLYKYEGSIDILKKIIDDLDRRCYSTDPESIAYSLYSAVKNSPSPFYKSILNKVVAKFSIDTIRHGGSIILPGNKKATENKPKVYTWYSKAFYFYD